MTPARLPQSPRRIRSRPARRTIRLAAAAVAALGLGLGGALATAGPARAATARVTFSPATADPDYATVLSLHGTGFQPIKGGFGGVYVLFGWVGAHWRPSQGGVSGTDYVYVQDAETKDNHGYEKFVSFQDGGTLAEANGGIISPDGTWSTTLTVPGAKFPAKGRDGGTRQVDCRQVQCGIITIGAHGVVDGENETFTPVKFAVPQPGSTAGQQAASAPAATAQAAAPSATASGDAGLVIPSSQASAATTSAGASPAAAEASSGASSKAGWWIIGGCVVVVLAVAVAGIALRRRSPGHPAGRA